ncbi:hypothetical protein AcV5_009999 [Taiwanofungus camphoratus]|nr:hypothetical protein AcV5_009999 [Antrodia cinnamomea]
MPGRKRNFSLRTTDTRPPASAENSSAPRPAVCAMAQSLNIAQSAGGPSAQREGRREENWKMGGAGRALWSPLFPSIVCPPVRRDVRRSFTRLRRVPRSRRTLFGPSGTLALSYR